MMHKLNVVFSKTNTLIGAGIRSILGGSWNHCAVAFDENLDVLYSFSRAYRYLWFTGCFTEEDRSGYLDYIVYSFDLSDEEYDMISSRIRLLKHGIHVYNYLGAVGLWLNVPIPLRGSYTCSTFVARLLSDAGLIKLNKSYALYRPMDLCELCNISSDCA